MTSLDTVQTFLKHVFAGTLEEALALVASEAQFISARPVPNPRVPVHGTFIGPAGAREFFRLFAALLEPVFELMSLPRRFAPMLAAAGVSQLLKTWQNVFLIQALSLDIPALCMWYVIPLFGVVSALPISIGGLGVREVVAHHLAAPLGMDNTHLVAFSLASQFIVTVVDMFGVLPFLFANRHRNGKKNA